MYSADCGFVDSRTRELTDLQTQNIYIRPNRWASLYLELDILYPSLDLRMVCYSGAVKIRQHCMAPTGRFGGGVLPPPPPRSTATGNNEFA